MGIAASSTLYECFGLLDFAGSFSKSDFFLKKKILPLEDISMDVSSAKENKIS